MSHATAVDAQEPVFDALLTPHRSLGRTGFLAVMGICAFVWLSSGVFFLSRGAWPVFGFFVLDVLLVYIAFRLNYRDGRLYETVDLAPGLLTVTRIHPSGKEEKFDFNPYWVRVQCAEAVDGRTALSLISHGKRMPFGQFLTDGERKEFASVLTDAIQVARAATH